MLLYELLKPVNRRLSLFAVVFSLPRILGVFMAIAGLSYQIFLSPPLATSLFLYLVLPAGALGEISFILWLLVFGVNSQRWKEQAGEDDMCILKQPDIIDYI
jgi:hypothetical protein